MYRLVALDMDGTLIHHDGMISAANIQATQRAADMGVHVILSTGRSRRGIQPFLEILTFDRQPVIVANGAEIFDESDRLLERSAISAEIIRQLHQTGLKKDCWFWGYTVENGEVSRERFVDRIEDYTWLKFGYTFGDASDCRQMWVDLESNDALELSNSHPLNIEINAAGTHKGYGLRRVCAHLDIPLAETIAMGDSFNDLSMIKEAGVGIAMGNAQPKVKEMADWVTDTNTNDGVAKALHHWLGW